MPLTHPNFYTVRERFKNYIALCLKKYLKLKVNVTAEVILIFEKNASDSAEVLYGNHQITFIESLKSALKTNMNIHININIIMTSSVVIREDI